MKKTILFEWKNKNFILTEADENNEEDSDIFEDEDEEVFGLEDEEKEQEQEQPQNNQNSNQEKTLTKDSPWGKIYKEYKNKDNFWKVYYKIVWEDNASRVEALGEAFEQELLALGFSEKLNPLIGFVQKYLLEFNLNKTNYTAIHDSLVRDYISKKDISGNGTLGDKNILFCKDLYRKSYQDILEYLSAQKEILNIDEIKATNETGTKIQKMSNNNISNLVNILLFDIPLQDKQIQLESDHIKNLVLRDQEDLLICLQAIGQEEVETSKSKDKQATAQFKKIINNVNTTADAQIALYAIATRFAVGDMKKILGMFNETTELDISKIAQGNNATKYQEYLNVLVKAGGASPSAVQELIKSIAEKTDNTGKNLLTKAGK